MPYSVDFVPAVGSAQDLALQHWLAEHPRVTVKEVRSVEGGLTVHFVDPAEAEAVFRSMVQNSPKPPPLPEGYEPGKGRGHPA